MASKASKRAAADAAYQAQEAQRALVKVIAAATDFSVEMKEWGGAEEIETLDRAIDTVRAHFLKIDTPPSLASARELPGQLAIDGSVTGEPVRELGAPMAEVFDVPKQCPACGENMLLVWGGAWTPLMHETEVGAPYQLQCALCSHVVQVSERAHGAVVAERRSTVGAADRKQKPQRERRVRGAG